MLCPCNAQSSVSIPVVFQVQNEQFRRFELLVDSLRRLQAHQAALTVIADCLFVAPDSVPDMVQLWVKCRADMRKNHDDADADAVLW